MQLWLAIAALVSAAAAVAGVVVCYKARNERRGPRRDRALHRYRKGR